MEKRWFRPAAALLCAALCASMWGCAPAEKDIEPGQSSPAPSAQTGAASPSEQGGEGAFRMTQESSVRNEKFREREEFAGFIGRAESKFLIAGLNQAMTPQGISYSEDTGLAYITSYAITDTPSAITGVSLETGEFAAEYYLFNPDGSPFTSHVGGIAVVGNTVYVSAKLDSDGSYSVAVLPLDQLPVSGSHDVTVEQTIPVPVSPSFLNYSRGTLWVGNFYHPKADYNLSPELNFTTQTADGEYGCYILGYRMEEDGTLTIPDGERYPVPDCAMAAPDRIQGVCCFGDEVVLSQSYGRGANSTLLFYRLPEGDEFDGTLDVCGRDIPCWVLDSARQNEAMNVMPMTEGLCLSPDGMLVLFESGSSRYSDGKYRTDHVWELKGQ